MTTMRERRRKLNPLSVPALVLASAVICITSLGPSGHASGVLSEIEQMEKRVGKRMYRGLLKAVARVWNPQDIRDAALQQKVLAHLQSAERGLHRAEAARDNAGLAAFAAVLGSLRLSSLDQVDNLKTLHEIVIGLEAVQQHPRS